MGGAVNVVEVITLLLYIADVDQEMPWVKMLTHGIASCFFKGAIR